MLLTLVHTCLKFEQSRARLINESWAKNLEDFFFICDSDEFSLPRSINLGPYRSGPTYHPATLLKIFKLFKTKFRKHDWLFVVDDDSYCFPEKLKKFLEFFDPNEPLIMGDFLNWPEHRNIHKAEHKGNYQSWVGGGPGIVFSRPAVTLLSTYAKKLPEKLVAHDVWLHYLLQSEGSHKIKKIHIPGFHQYGARKLLKTHELTSNQLISVHLNGQMTLLKAFSHPTHAAE